MNLYRYPKPTCVSSGDAPYVKPGAAHYVVDPQDDEHLGIRLFNDFWPFLASSPSLWGPEEVADRLVSETQGLTSCLSGCHLRLFTFLQLLPRLKACHITHILPR